MPSPLTPQQATNNFKLLLDIVRSGISPNQLVNELELQLTGRIAQGVLGDDKHPAAPTNPKFTQMLEIAGQLHCLGRDSTIYRFNPAARTNSDGQWEICGLDTADTRFWIPLPPP